MEKEDLRKVQLIQLEILKEAVRICDRHNIDYWLAGGTQLGAVRHNGFIPWDDDLDIAMLRANYEKFLHFASKELDTQYYLQEWRLDEKYGLPFTKIRKKNHYLLKCIKKHKIS
jgi:lipopolysaccharide cholinephosphotransferase